MADVIKSIGTASRDYSTFTLWEADINNTTYPSAGTRAVGEPFNDSVFDEAFRISYTASNVTQTLLTVPVSERSDGTRGNGSRIVRTATKCFIESNLFFSSC